MKMSFFELAWYLAIVGYGLSGICFMIDEVKKQLREQCDCGDKIPEGGGMASQQMLCECGEYYHRMIVRREDELKRIEEEKKKGNDYDTTL